MDLDGGAGFDRGFLAEQVNPPTCDPGELLTVDGSPELRYMHFSLALHAERRLARWVAWNIDGPTRWDGDDIPRQGLRFLPDPRIPADAQVEMDAKKAAGYFTEIVPDAEELMRAKGRGLSD